MHAANGLRTAGAWKRAGGPVLHGDAVLFEPVPERLTVIAASDSSVAWRFAARNASRSSSSIMNM